MTMQCHDDKLNHFINHYKSIGLLRHRLSLDKRTGAHWQFQDQSFLSFMNNDYLGLSTHPKVIQAFQEGAQQYGVGSGAAQLLGGYHVAHQKLEEHLADFIGMDRALLFSSGYMANLAVLISLIARQDTVFADRLNHASLVDGGRFCQGTFIRYRHCNMKDLASRLQSSSAQTKWIVTEGVFSMDGDFAPLPDLILLAKTFDSNIILDDAHGIGVLGKYGGGTLEHYGLSPKNITVFIGTLGKAFGTMGAFVAGSTLLIEYLINFARTFIYTTAPPPAIAHATLESLKIIQKETWRREHLTSMIELFREKAAQRGLSISYSNTPIQTMILGNVEKALNYFHLLKKKRILVGCIRPPTVPFQTSRLRINLNVNHNHQDIDYLCETLAFLNDNQNHD